MSDSVILVENLSKKYVIGHQRQERYTALRDVLEQNAYCDQVCTSDKTKRKIPV